MSQYTLAFGDLKGAFTNFNTILHLGWSEIKDRYRGSFLGPLWITLSMTIFIVALGTVYARLFHQNIETFIPFLASGMLIWTYITSNIIESCDVFVASKNFIENIKLPYSIYIWKLIWRNMIIFLHNSIVYLGIVFFMHIPINWTILLFVPFFTLATINLFAVATILSLLGTRYRDLPPIITSFITVIFFISPVTWPPEMLGNHSWILKLNPFSYYLDILRSPLLGKAPSELSVLVCCVIAIISMLIAFVSFSKYRRQIPFWL